MHIISDTNNKDKYMQTIYDTNNKNINIQGVQVCLFVLPVKSLSLVKLTFV